MQATTELQEYGLVAGIVIARSVQIRPSSEALRRTLRELVSDRQHEEFPPPALKEAVRALLKKGGFKPSGRNKPASEYLAQAAREGRFPEINNVVDVNNMMSLRSGLPISLLDLNVVGSALVLRFGRQGERYVFNSAGQEIDLQGLICACSAESDTPLGNPVKDSMSGKVSDQTRDVVGIIYAPAAEVETMIEQYATEFKDWLNSEGEAKSSEALII